MNTYTVEKIKEILALHKKFWNGEAGGKRAYLQGAYLQRANLQGANLQGAYLQGANLQRANLQGAYLQGANLQGADLQGAYLQRANLQGANLQRANLQGANLQGANLQGADLQGAYLQGAYLQGAKYGTDDDTELMVNYFCVGPIGSRSDYLQVFHTNKRIELKTGCFAGSVDAFEAEVVATHGENKHGKDYVAAIAFVRQMTAEVSP